MKRIERMKFWLTKSKPMETDEIHEQLYAQAEYEANIYNEHCLLVLAGILLICVFLNEIGIYNIDRKLLLLSYSIGVLFYLTPTVVTMVVKLISHGTYIPAKHCWFKYIIVLCSYLGVLIANIALTQHAILMLAIPMFNIAQYKDIGKLLPLGLVMSTICIVSGVYLGYFFGILDLNLVGIAYNNCSHEADFALRLKLATPNRMKELLYYFVIPREIIMTGLLVLAYATTRRNNLIIEKQVDLQKEVEKEMNRTNHMQSEVIEGMATLIESRDLSTGEHVKRTRIYVQMITNQLITTKDITYKEAQHIVKAAPLHDIGKIVVADRILQKPGKLSPEEYEEIKLHSTQGEEVIQRIFESIEDETFLHIATEISGAHHERWDGTGYPKNLKGEDIPLSARIMAIADVFDALVSKRVYKEAFQLEDAFQIMKQGAGTQFDPYLVDVFLGLKAKILDYLNQEETR